MDSPETRNIQRRKRQKAVMEKFSNFLDPAKPLDPTIDFLAGTVAGEHSSRLLPQDTELFMYRHISTFPTYLNSHAERMTPCQSLVVGFPFDTG